MPQALQGCSHGRGGYLPCTLATEFPDFNSSVGTTEYAINNIPSCPDQVTGSLLRFADPCELLDGAAKTGAALKPTIDAVGK